MPGRVFTRSPDDSWHSLAVHVQRAETAFAPLPVSWEREGQNGELVWVYQDDASKGYLARLLGDDAKQLRSLLTNSGAVKLTVKAKRREHHAAGLMEIGRVERLGWGKGHRVFEVPYRSPTAVDSLGAEAWLGCVETQHLLGAIQSVD